MTSSRCASFASTSAVSKASGLPANDYPPAPLPQIFMASEITTLFTLKTFARDSIQVSQRTTKFQTLYPFDFFLSLCISLIAELTEQFSMLEDEDKSMALSLWEKRWVAFIKDLVATYVE